jgi:hypothetical protein
MVLRVAEGIEALERVANERQAEVGVVSLAGSLCRGAHLGGRIDLRNLVDGEVLRVDGAGKLGLEWSTDLAKTIPIDTAEEWVLFELSGTTHVAETVLRVANEATKSLATVEPIMSCELTL